MAKSAPTPTLYTPDHRNGAHAARSASIPRWFLREAVAAFELSAYDQVVFIQIADNLDATGSSRTATSLIAERAQISRQTAVTSIAHLLECKLIIELVEKRNGAIMRYGIPREMPLPRVFPRPRQR